MKNVDFLTNLKVEIKDANSGVGKAPTDIQSYQTRIGGILSSLEEKMNSIVNDDSYKISDIHVNVENEKIFRSIILDLESKEIIMHKEDFLIKNYPKSIVSTSILESRKMMQTTCTLTEMIGGKNIIMVNKRGFRKYVKDFKKIISDPQTINSIQGKENDGDDLNKIKLSKTKEKTFISYKGHKVIVLGSETHMVKLVEMFKKKNSWTLDIQPVFLELYKDSKSKHRNVTSIECMRDVLAQTKIRKNSYFNPIKYKISLNFPTRSTVKLIIKSEMKK